MTRWRRRPAGPDAETEARVRRALADAAAGIEPAPGLDAIRARTRKPRRPWWRRHPRTP